jgi:hypothetical protein
MRLKLARRIDRYVPMDSVRMRHLKELLVAPPPIAAARAERRRWVDEALYDVMGALEEGALPFGEWERRCLPLALEAMRDGFYDIAMFHVQSMLVAKEHRARQANMPKGTDLSLEEMREMFELARDGPV